MTTVEYKQNCALCGLLVEIHGFSLVTKEGSKAFCCAGCQSIYQLIYMDSQGCGIRAQDPKFNNEITTKNNKDDD